MSHDVVTRYNWQLVRGDDTTRIIYYQDSTGSAIDLTGFTAELEYTRAGVTSTIAGTVDEPLGKITVSISNAVTALWSSNPTFKLRLTSGGGVVTTILIGEFEVEQ